MARRKTLNVSTLVEEVNTMLRESTCSKDARLGMCAVLERMLHETGNYDGFRYLMRDEIPEGHKPGIDLSISYEDPDNRYPDDSRRQYGWKTRPSKTQ